MQFKRNFFQFLTNTGQRCHFKFPGPNKYLILRKSLSMRNFLILKLEKWGLPSGRMSSVDCTVPSKAQWSLQSVIRCRRGACGLITVVNWATLASYSRASTAPSSRPAPKIQIRLIFKNIFKNLLSIILRTFQEQDRRRNKTWKC